MCTLLTANNSQLPSNTEQTIAKIMIRFAEPTAVGE